MEKPRRPVVVTGFGPFGEHSVNASWIAVQELEKLGLGDEVDLYVYEIPVEYQAVQRLIPALWKKHSPQVTRGARRPLRHGHDSDAGKVWPQRRLPGSGQLPLLPGLPLLRRRRARMYRLRHRHGRRAQEGLRPRARRHRHGLKGRWPVPLRLHLLHVPLPEPRPLGLRPRASPGEALQRRAAGAGLAVHHRGDVERPRKLGEQHQLPQRTLRRPPRGFPSRKHSAFSDLESSGG